MDRQDFEAVETYGVERWPGELALALRQETYRPDPIRREIAAPIAGFCERSLAMRGDRSLARGIAFEGMSVEAVRAARQDRRGRVEGKRRKVGRSDFGEAEPPNSCRRGLAHERHDRMTDAHRHEIVLSRLVGVGRLIDLLDLRKTSRASRRLFRHRGDLMDADQRGWTNEPFYAPGQNEGTGGCALGAASDRLTFRVRARAGARRTFLNQRAGHHDCETLLPDELAHRRGVGE